MADWLVERGLVKESPISRGGLEIVGTSVPKPEE
jgi:hypothetical protein